MSSFRSVAASARRSEGAGRRHSTVPVAGGELFVELCGPPPSSAEATVVLIHGITANAVGWRLVTSRLAPPVAAVAVDLRGRAGSAGLPGPFGMRAHAADMVSVLDHLGVERAVVVGHSMGAFVATTMMERNAERVQAAVLVDGGVPPGLTVESTVAGDDVDIRLDRFLRPELKRLQLVFSSPEDALASWRSHPAFRPHGAWNETVEALVMHDLGGSRPRFASRCNEAAIIHDVAELLSDAAVVSAIERTSVPCEVLRVERGPTDEPTPTITEQAAFDVARRNRSISVLTVPGLNHYTVLLHPQGADAVAASIGRAVRAGRASP